MSLIPWTERELVSLSLSVSPRSLATKNMSVVSHLCGVGSLARSDPGQKHFLFAFPRSAESRHRGTGSLSAFLAHGGHL